MSKNSLHEPPIKLEGFTLLNLALDTMEHFDCDAETANSRLDITFAPELHAEDQRRFRVTLTVTLGPETKNSNIPYSMSARCAGYFIAAKEIVHDAVDPALFVNALTIMYGALRGLIFQSTATCGNGAAILPTVMMADVVASHISRGQGLAARTAEPRTATPKPRKAVAPRRGKKK